MYFFYCLIIGYIYVFYLGYWDFYIEFLINILLYIKKKVKVLFWGIVDNNLLDMMKKLCIC